MSFAKGGVVIGERGPEIIAPRSKYEVFNKPMVKNLDAQTGVDIVDDPQSGIEYEEIYILMADDSMTTFSMPTPTGYAVRTEEEAKQFVARQFHGNRAYEKVKLIKNSK